VIESFCPHCDGYLKLEFWKQGLFLKCPYCDEYFIVKGRYGGEIQSDQKYDIEYKQFLDLLINDLDYLNQILKERFNICIYSRWKSNTLLDFYAFKFQHPEERYDLIDVFKKIHEDDDLREKVYQKWMSIFK
jgi:hypothetical protein